MSLTLEDLLLQAQKLVEDLQEDEEELDKALKHAEHTEREMRHLDEYKYFAEQMSNVSIQEEEDDRKNQISNATKIKMIQEVHHESERHTTLLKDLRSMKDYVLTLQSCIDIIMNKYRQQVADLTRMKTEAEKLALITVKEADKDIADEKQKSFHKMEKMRKAFKMALKLDEGVFARNEELLTRLAIENKGLREMLGISGQYSNYSTLRKINVDAENKDTQTEDFKDIGKNLLASGDSTAVLDCEPKSERSEFFLEDSETTSSTSSFFSFPEMDNNDDERYPAISANAI